MGNPQLAATATSWTDNIIEDEHIIFFKTRNWAASLLGPLESWSLSLRLYTYQVLSDSRPACLYMGPGRVAIYNHPFVPLASVTHPALMGSRFQDIYTEIYEALAPVFDGAEESKKAVDVVELPLTIARKCAREETYFSGTFNPVRGLDGEVEGFYHVCTEVTRQKLTDRRSTMFDFMSLPTERLTSTNVGQHIMKSFSTNAVDTPMAILYQAEPDPDLKSGLLTLRGYIGLAEDHPLLVPQGKISSNEGLFPLFREVESHHITLPTDGKFEGALWAGFGEPSDHVSVIPLSSTGQSLGFLVIGANPRRPIDDDHERFCSDLAFKVSSVIAAAHSREKQAVSEQHIRYMAKHLDVGLEHLTMEGRVIWANDHYFDIINDRPTPDFYQRTLPFQSHVFEEDQPKISQAWKECVIGVRATTMELRMNKMYEPPVGPPVYSTVLLSAFPFIENGEITSIMACMTDVSRLKWAEAWQTRAAQDAQEAKRQQSEFTDAISHEVRNPLSAIMQLADSISLSQNDLVGQESRDIPAHMEVIRQNVEAAKTIMLCAAHQKKIVDDVLTLSRLDFNSMTLNATAVQPAELVSNALQMLQADIVAADIKLAIKPNKSIHDMAVDWVMCDSLRITQVLLNLISNACKFIKHEKRREIVIEYGCSISEPKNFFSKDILWVEPKQDCADITLDEAWGTGEPLYLTFSVSDTGPGMTFEECRHLFNKFQQANPQTSIRYGGTGLGLYISHSLVEKHYGSIGLSSEHGKGSTFAVIVKVRRSELPTNTVSRLVESPTLEESNGRRIAKGASRTLRANGEPMHKGGWHILLVEDNLVNQRILQKQLKKAGCIVTVANHGQEALDILRSTNKWRDNLDGAPLDVVLMDVEMPVMDGLTASREIRSLEKVGELIDHIEVLAVTANVRQEQIERAMAAGVDGCLPKPFLVAELLATIKERLGRQQQDIGSKYKAIQH